MVKALDCCPEEKGINSVTDITFSFAAIHFLVVCIYHIVSSKASSSPTVPIWMVCEVKDPLSQKKCRCELSPPHLMHHISAMI